MSSAINNLLSGLIDYAGLFPPAKLPMEEAVNNYFSYRDSAEQWLMARFICPAGRLRELAATAPQESTMKIAVVGSTSSAGKSFLNEAMTDIKLIGDFHSDHFPRLSCDVYETRLGDDDTTAVDQQFISKFAGILKEANIRNYFIEPVSRDFWLRSGESICQSLSGSNQDSGNPAGGVKVRCGGIDMKAVPTVVFLASFIISAQKSAVPFKATAGLHHPLRHYDKELDGEVHGFLNVFTAAVLSNCHQLTSEEIMEILQEKDLNEFGFEEDKIRWRNYTVNPDDIYQARKKFAISYGSCSFTEPVEDLQRIKLI